MHNIWLFLAPISIEELENPPIIFMDVLEICTLFGLIFSVKFLSRTGYVWARAFSLRCRFVQFLLVRIRFQIPRFYLKDLVCDRAINFAGVLNRHLSCTKPPLQG